MARSWTTQQQQAIDARGGNLLVSAAAGSGKTAVLVERVIRRLSDVQSPVAADRLLIVTFTRAAAGEIRQRIGDALQEEMLRRPGDRRLAEQQMLLPFAKICTIDAFCSALVREHFESLGLAPDFKTADDGELQILSEQAMAQTLEDCYARGDEDFLRLVELLFKGRDDAFLEEIIRTLYTESRSYPFPQLWLDEVGKLYQSDLPMMRHPFTKTLTQQILDAAAYARSLLGWGLSAVQGDEVLEKLFYEVFTSDLQQLEKVTDALTNGDWDKAKAAAESYTPLRRPPTPKDYRGDPMIDRLALVRDEAKGILREKITPLFCCDSASFDSDLAFFAPLIAQLVAAAGQYADAFDALKKEKQVADFSDIMHSALQLLYTQNDAGDYVPSDLSKEIAQSYDEILIDEYQDTNLAQDMLFTAIARDNLFRVGDVKQSIYRFRQAMPEIFIRLKDQYAPYPPQNPAAPSKILLSKNFRSRKAVTESVNFIFSQIMSRACGDVDYDDAESLVCGAVYPDAEECCELHLLDLSELDTDRDSGDAFQADYIAKHIRQMIDSGFQVRDGDGMRPARYEDFCILLRSINGGRGAVYAEALKKQNLPCFTEVSADFFSATEVSLMLNLLRVIDNPKQDVALLSVLLSVLFGFSPDDCARLRLFDPAGDLYACLLLAEKQGSEKAVRFLRRLADWRTLALGMSVSDFLRMLYDDTAILAAVSAMPGAAGKRTNLLLLLDYAAVYENAGYIGLSGFIRFIDRLERTKGDLAGSVGVSAETNVVRVMSIHKSKGLEFPVCIVANCAGRFNASDRNRGVVIHPSLGIGAQRRETDTLAQYPTIPLLAVRARDRADTISEEMRVLYVALTRAKERLILVGAIKNPEKAFAKYQPRLLSPNGKLPPFAAQAVSSYADWLYPALLRHPDAEKLREWGGYDDSVVLPASFRLEIYTEKWHLRPSETAKPQPHAAPDPALAAALDASFSWRYAYEPLTKLVSKRAASEVDKGFVDREYFASSMPQFLSADGLSAAQRGTATHTFMQYADFDAARQSVEQEISRLVQSGHITPQEGKAINRTAVRRFFSSELFARMQNSPLVMREKKFTVEVPVQRLYPEMTGFPDETMLIQGIADCAFLEDGALVVVDYKTDRLETDAQFIEKYAGQVGIYKMALSLCTDYPVKETVLYAFHLHRAIVVDNEEKNDIML